MLVLSRKAGESIKIGEGVEVKILGFEGNRIRVGITAPTGVRILRSEIPENNATKPLDRPANDGYDSGERKIA